MPSPLHMSRAKQQRLRKKSIMELAEREFQHRRSMDIAKLQLEYDEAYLRKQILAAKWGTSSHEGS